MKPEEDPRVIQENKDLQALLNCMQRVARGHTFNYCNLDQIDHVIACKTQRKFDAILNLHRLAGNRPTALRKARDTFSHPRWSVKFCGCNKSVMTGKQLEHIVYEMKVEHIRIQILGSLILELSHIRRNGPKLKTKVPMMDKRMSSVCR